MNGIIYMTEFCTLLSTIQMHGFGRGPRKMTFNEPFNDNKNDCLKLPKVLDTNVFMFQQSGTYMTITNGMVVEQGASLAVT